VKEGCLHFTKRKTNVKVFQNIQILVKKIPPPPLPPPKTSDVGNYKNKYEGLWQINY